MMGNMYNFYRSPVHQKQEVSNTSRCLEMASNVLTFYVLTLNLYFNLSLNNFSNIVYQ